jgi:hypothetical protein
MAYSSSTVLSLYRNLLRQSHRFHHYNFREYFLKKTRTEFREQICVKDNTELVNAALQDLALLRRQATISNMYHFDKLVVEKMDKHHYV